MKLKSAIKELELLPTEEIFCHMYGKDDYTKDPTPISELSSALLNKEVLLVQPNHGGQEHGYNKLMFILK